jgi:hypothetical protein
MGLFQSLKRLRCKACESLISTDSQRRSFPNPEFRLASGEMSEATFQTAGFFP